MIQVLSFMTLQNVVLEVVLAAEAQEEDIILEKKQIITPTGIRFIQLGILHITSTCPPVIITRPIDIYMFLVLIITTGQVMTSTLQKEQTNMETQHLFLILKKVRPELMEMAQAVRVLTLKTQRLFGKKQQLET